tara:strand:- start:961 stop:1632 length:672 start_codon:yes stop_codon:yes gene_type:complete
MNITRPDYASASVIGKHISICSATLRRWSESGRISSIQKDGSGRHLYKVSDVEREVGLSTSRQHNQEKESIAYARVSSQTQKADLDRQVGDLKKLYPGHRIISDIGSGLNFKRPGFVSMVDAVLQGRVKRIVVMHRDRLCRFGADLLERIFEKTGVELVVHDRSETTNSSMSQTAELADDLIAVTTFFTARHNGQRSSQNRKRRRQEEGQNTLQDKVAKSVSQ